LMDNIADFGCYQIILKLTEKKRVRIGALGILTFHPGYYVYTGRAKRGLAARVARHKRKSGKRKFWHIDYLLPVSAMVRIVLFPGRLDECIINKDLLNETSDARLVRKFGSSDCKCPGHLIWMETLPHYDKKALS